MSVNHETGAKQEKEALPTQEVAVMDEEEEKLRTVRGAVPLNVWLINVVIFLERASFYGVSAPFQNYVQNPPNNPTRPGALGLGQTVAVACSYAFLFTNYLTPIMGAVLADCWLGRFQVIQIGFGLDLVALSILFGTAYSQEVHGTGGLAGFILTMVLLGLGVGCTRPNLVTFVTDQYTVEEGRIITLKSGEKVMTSREMTIEYIYNVNYWMTNVGGLAGIITTFVEKTAGFRFAFLVPLCSVSVSAAVLMGGRKRYVHNPPSGNVLPKALKALIYRKPIQTSPEVAGQPATSSSTTPTISPAELKAVFKSCWVFIPFPALVLCIDLMGNNLVAQAGQMQTHGLPNDIMWNLNPISVMILLPCIQGGLVPFLSKRRIRFTPYHRIIIGLFCAAIAIGYTAGLQHIIYRSGPCFDHPLTCLPNLPAGPNHVNVGLQTPVYIFLALAEIFAIVAATELAYTQTPKSMKSIVQAIFILSGSLGSLMGIGLSFASRDPFMVAVYASVSGFMGVVACVFAVYALRFVKGRDVVEERS
ncbi:oligopeptide transporter [Byssothecium circinans]|uniref:Oligopeptide transporter n=1 Tax=Byssothecium circinans TaxID=147558 RepID=A0A6A5U944_9PLEO|nr:oligopeptide transporter [Byssothecium circinans]